MDETHRLTTFSLDGSTYDIRYYPSTIELRNVQETWGEKFPHVRPDSVFVGSIGTNWSKGAWQKVIDMVEHTNKMGVCCWFNEIPDNKCTVPYHDISMMRDMACMHAHNLGFEWFLMLENDALPEKDLILRLLKWQVSVISPYIVDSDRSKTIAWPHHERGNGIKPVNWTALTCLLLWTKVLNCFDSCRPFQDTFTEGDFFNKLAHYGHRAYQDTNTDLAIAKNPTYHGTLNSLHDTWRFWEDIDKDRRKSSDRKPIDSKDEREVYLL